MRELIVCLIIFASGVYAYLHFFPELYPEEHSKIERNSDVFPDISRAKQKSVVEKNIVRRDVTPDSVLPAFIPEGETLERLPAIVPPPPPPKPAKPKDWQRPVVVSAGVVKSSGKLLIMKGIDPLPLKTKCKYDSGQEWPCGMLARTEMRQFVRGRTIKCEPNTDDETDSFKARCNLASFDISAWLVLTGWAKPEDGLFETELAEAQAKQRGQWRKNAP